MYQSLQQTFASFEPHHALKGTLFLNEFWTWIGHRA